jgi:hypothetical protein
MKIYIHNKNIPIKKRNIPNNVTHIIFGDEFNQEIKYFPPKLKSIKFGSSYNKPIYLPAGIEEVEFGNEFNQYIDFLPESIKVLKFGPKFNSNIRSYPPNLETLEFGDDYNKSINNLSPKLKKLVLGFGYNQFIERLPKNLLYLEFNFDTYFEQAICNLPANLHTLIIKNSYLGQMMPDPKYWQLKHCSTPELKLPNSLRILELRMYLEFIKLPDQIEKVILNGFINGEINFPDSVSHLEIGFGYNYPIKKLPKKLQVLKFFNQRNNQTNHPLPELPPDLRILHLDNNYNNYIDKFPSGLKKLTLGNKFNQKLDNLPNGLEELFIGKSYDYPINDLPSTIEILTIWNMSTNVMMSVPYFIKKLRIINGLGFPQNMDDLNTKRIILPMILDTLILNGFYIDGITEENMHFRLFDKIPFGCSIEYTFDYY